MKFNWLFLQSRHLKGFRLHGGTVYEKSKSTFQLISISPIESPYKSLIIFEFDENKVNLVLASASFEFRADVEGV
ncbi:MAG: hypothetical protein ACOYIG_11370, partial [Acetivibrionales bacterium]